jgi:hypothetical protein
MIRLISVSPTVTIIIWRKLLSAAGTRLCHKDQIAIPTKTAAAARHVLYGRMRFRGVPSVYVLRYLVLVTGTISHQVPSEIAEMVIFVRTSFSMVSVRFNECLGSKHP